MVRGKKEGYYMIIRKIGKDENAEIFLKEFKLYHQTDAYWICWLAFKKEITYVLGICKKKIHKITK